MTGLETEKGIKIIIIVQVITLIVGVVTIISAILLFARTGVGLFFIGLFCLLSIGILVLSIIGLVKIYRGRQEFGEEHAQKVKTGMILIIVGICVTLFIGPIGGILSGLGFVFLIVKIAQKKYRTLLWAGFGMSILASVMNLVSLVMQFSSADSITVLGGVNIFMGASGLVGSILTLMAYHGTYKGIKEGIISPFTAQSLMPPSGYDSLPPDLFPPKYPPSDHLGAYTPQTQIPPPPPEHYQGSALYKKPNLNNNDNSNDVRTDFMETKYTTKEDITDTLYEEKGSFQENDIELHGEYKLEERKKDRPIDRVDNTSTDSRLQNSSLCGQEVDYYPKTTEEKKHLNISTPMTESSKEPIVRDIDSSRIEPKDEDHTDSDGEDDMVKLICQMHNVEDKNPRDIAKALHISAREVRDIIYIHSKSHK